MSRQRITKAIALESWRKYEKPAVLEQFPNDKPALRLSWHYYIDRLCKDGYITLRQYETWDNPKECK